MKKVFDSEKRTWAGKESKGNDNFLDIEVAFKFAINQIRFNSGLNEDFIEALQDPGNKQKLISPLLTDYELNHRQIVLYLVDCEVINCSPSAKQNIETMLTNTPVSIIWNPPVQVVASNLAAEIRASLTNLV